MVDHAILIKDLEKSFQHKQVIAPPFFNDSKRAINGFTWSIRLW
ncbi:hypothetical protein GCM10017717_33860 [Deinococcus persicinus]